MTKIAVIVNPHSSRNKKSKGRSMDEFRNIGGDMVEVISAGTIEELGNLAGKCKTMGVDYIAISGGDGTLHNVITAFINSYKPDPIPPVLVLKDGTMNNVAASVRLKGNGYAILKRILNALKQNKPIDTVPRYTMQIGDSYCFLFGIGITTNILNAVYEGGKKDIKKVIKVVIRALIDALFHPYTSSLYKRLKAEVYFDGEKVNTDDMLGVLAGTVEDIGMGVRPLNKNMAGKPGFHVIATGVKPIVLVRNLPMLAFGRTLRHPLHHDRRVHRLLLKSADNFEYTMDGDLYVADNEVYVETGPTIRFVSV